MDATQHRKKCIISPVCVVHPLKLGFIIQMIFHMPLMTVMEAMRPMRRQGRHRQLDQRSPRCIGVVLPCLRLSLDDYCTNYKRNSKRTARTHRIPRSPDNASMRRCPGGDATTRTTPTTCPGRKAGRRVADHCHIVVVWVGPQNATPAGLQRIMRRRGGSQSDTTP